MFKVILTGLLVFLLSGPVRAATQYAASASRTAVSNAIAGANRDDWVSVPSGTATWTSALTITKGIKLVGNGVGSTVITCSNGEWLLYTPDSTTIANKYIFGVEGFTIDGSNSSGQLIEFRSDEAEIASGATIVVKIGDNTFRDKEGTVLDFHGQFRGVIYNNTFDRCNVILEPMGNNEESEWANYSDDIVYGIRDNLFFEDNTIQYSSGGRTGDPGWIESGQCGRVVARYNTWNMANADEAELWDIHGAQYSTIWGTMIVEYYGNTLITASPFQWILHRGSWGLFFNNVATGGGGMDIEVAAYNNGCDEQYGYPVEVNNTYAWNNTHNGGEEAWSEQQDNCGISENSNYWDYNASCSGSGSCSSGIGRGTSAPDGTSTSGVGFWVASTATPTVDSDVIQNGTFYKSVGNSWTAYYTPFTYPHPLRGEGGGGDPPGDTCANDSDSSNIYWVGPSGTTNWECSEKASDPGSAFYCSLSTANVSASAGDIIYVTDGTYSTYIYPTNSGSNGSPISFIGESATGVTITGADYGIRLAGSDYITVQGINFYNLDSFLKLDNGANYNIISGCTFLEMRNRDWWAGSRLFNDCQYNHIKDCTFGVYGECSVGGSDLSGVLDIGHDDTSGDQSYYNVVSGCTFYHGGHHVVGLYTGYNVFRNNYVYNNAWSRGKGNRNIDMVGFDGWNLVENNRVGYSYIPCDEWGSSAIKLACSNNILRYNEFFYNDLAGIVLGVGSSYNDDVDDNRIYNNTFMDNGWNPGDSYDHSENSQIGFNNWSGGAYTIQGNVIKNNLMYDHYQTFDYYAVNSGDQTFTNNWDGDTQGDPEFTNATSTPGDVTASAYPDLTLLGSSPVINQGVALTTVASATGSGSSFVLDDASYFQDGSWGPSGVLEADVVAVGTVSNTVKISSINYGTDTVTLDSSISWNNGDDVWLYQDSDGTLVLYGTAPDIGANERLAPIPQPVLPPGRLEITTGALGRGVGAASNLLGEIR